MNRIHALVVTAIVGGAVAVGGVAFSRSGADRAPNPPAAPTSAGDQTRAERIAEPDALETSRDTAPVRPHVAAPTTMTVPAKPPGTLSQRDADDDNSGGRDEDEGWNTASGGDDD